MKKKEPKFRYNLNLKSTKKQKITCIIAASLLFLINFINLGSSNPSETFSIIITISDFVIMFTALFIILKDNSKEVKRAKLREELEYKTYQNEKDILEEYKEKMYNLDLTKLSHDEKVEYVFYALQEAYNEKDLYRFYVLVRDFKIDEVRDLISSIRLSDDLKNFMENVVFNLKYSNEFFRYAYELEMIERHFIFDDPLDDSFFKDNVFYNRLYYYRAIYTYDEKKKKYIVKSECYSNYYGFFKWVQMPEKGKYRSKEKAIKKCEKIINRHKDKKYVFGSPKELNEDIYRNNVFWELSRKEKLPEPYQTLSKYISTCVDEGHQVFFDNNKGKMKDTLETLKSILPKDFYSNVSQAYRNRTNPANIMTAERFLKDNFNELASITDGYSFKLDINLIKDYTFGHSYNGENIIPVKTVLPFVVAFLIVDTVDCHFIGLLKAHNVHFGMFRKDGFRNGKITVSLFKTFKKNERVLVDEILPELDSKLRWLCEEEYLNTLKIIKK